MLILVAIGPLFAATLTVEGACPGRPEVRIEGATPGSAALIIRADDVGRDLVPGGPCAGAAMGLDAGSAVLVQRRRVGPGGGVGVRPPLGPADCGDWMIAFDLSTCTATAPAQLGDALLLRRTLFTALDDATVVEVLGDHSRTEAWRDDAPALIAVSSLNGLGVVGGRADRDVDDGETLRVVFDEPAWLVSLTAAMASDLDGDGVLGAVSVEAVDGLGRPIGPVRGAIADLVDVSGWLGVDDLAELSVTAVSDSFRLASVGHLGPG